MKYLFENWRKYILKEREGLSDPVIDPVTGEVLKDTESSDTQVDNQEVSTVDNTIPMHVKYAQEEMAKFKNGKIKESDPESWPLIAKYWDHIGVKWAVKSTLAGAYRIKKDNPRTKNIENWMSEEGHWSAAFILYCMRDNSEFQKLKWGKKAMHDYYWRPARGNAEKLFKGKSIGENDWIMLTLSESEKFGYSAQVGDIVMQRQYKRPHGDIVTPVGKIGGNLSDSVKVTTADSIAVITQDPAVKKKIRKILNLPPQ